jgi:hypothetical protein
MKKAIVTLLASLLALSLGACATTKKEEQIRVKCPACGYEFMAPAER